MTTIMIVIFTRDLGEKEMEKARATATFVDSTAFKTAKKVFETNPCIWFGQTVP